MYETGISPVHNVQMAQVICPPFLTHGCSCCSHPGKIPVLLAPCLLSLCTPPFGSLLMHDAHVVLQGGGRPFHGCPTSVPQPLVPLVFVPRTTTVAHTFTIAEMKTNPLAKQGLVPVVAREHGFTSVYARIVHLPLEATRFHS